MLYQYMDCVASNGRVMMIGKDLEDGDGGLMVVLSWRLPGVTEEVNGNHGQGSRCPGHDSIQC
jgi:hypothetical protein